MSNIIAESIIKGDNFSIGAFNIICENVVIGKNVTIGNNCVIQDGCVIGDNVTVESFSLIEKNSKIGNDTFVGTYTKIGSNAEIGSSCRMTSYCEIRSNCKVGNSTSFGSRCTLSSGTIVEDNVIVKYGFVATDTPVLNEKEKSLCIMKRGSMYGANVVLMPGIKVGINAEIGACSQVRHDVGDNEIWYGSPAKFYKKSN